MILRMPSYCKNFKCTAEKCTDNCCIGWEIDIDPSSAEYYKSVGGTFGERLRKDIAFGEVCSFKMNSERCAFLNDRNLCDIIINLGEDALCQICRDHPRYFEWYSAVKEGGVGLCCEEGARLILSQKEKFSTYDTPCDDEGEEGYDEDLYDYLLFAREQIIYMLENENLPLGVRLSSVLSFAHKVQENTDNFCYEKENISVTDQALPVDTAHIAEKFMRLEAIDGKWISYRENLRDNLEEIEKNISACTVPDEKISRYLHNIAVYFIWRYFMKGVFDEDIISKVWLCIVSVLFIERMFVLSFIQGQELSLENCSILAKNYSKEIEYSEENLNMLGM